MNNTMKKSKSIQKVTDPSKIKTYETFKKYQGTPSEDIILDYYYNMLNDAAKNNDGKKEDEVKDIIYTLLQGNPESIASTKNQMWEANECRIQNSMLNLIKINHQMPTVMEISINSGLSRKTIYQHLKNQGESAEFRKAYMKQFIYQRNLVLAALFRIGIQQNDTKALKAYLEYTGGIEIYSNGNCNHVKKQNNYIQINNKVISQQFIQSLSHQQEKAIMEIINCALPIQE